MNSLLRCLQDLNPAMLRAVAENHGQPSRASAAELAAVLTAPGYLAGVVADSPPAAGDALGVLIREGGRMPVTAFERRYGQIRSFGPGRLERERPHRSPANASETLWYLGVIFRTVAETSAGLAEFLAVPDELLALLPKEQTAADRQRFELPASSQPAVCTLAFDALPHDLCSLLCLVQAGEVRLAQSGDPLAWHSNSLYALAGLMLQPTEISALIDARAPGSAAALAFSLAGELGFLQASGRAVRLDAQPVQQWLLAGRAEQRRVLLEAWQVSTRWNDLCRTPALQCEETGGWANDPSATRARLLPLLAELDAGPWYAVDRFVEAVKAQTPDFQRPDGDYSTWYIRRRDDPVFLRGFEGWDEVEGALLRFFISGPLHWLGAVQTGADPDGAALFTVSADGARWLAREAPPQVECSGSPVVLSDFSVTVPANAPLMDRFRVARFTTWEQAGGDGEPLFRYRITQTGLRRAARQGIAPPRVLEYLRDRCGATLPQNVDAALANWQP